MFLQQKECREICLFEMNKDSKFAMQIYMFTETPLA